MHQAKDPNNNRLCDLFDREGGGDFNEAVPTAPATRAENDSIQPPPAHFSEDLWQDAVRRHQGSRQHWRQLLDRYIKPH